MIKSLTTNQRASLGLLLFAVALVLAPWIVGHAGGNTWVRTLDFALLYIMLALGLNIVVGYAGLLDMGFIAFYAVGAYLAALLSSPHLLQQFPALLALLPAGMHTSIWLILPLGALLAAGCGVVLGARPCACAVITWPSSPWGLARSFVSCCATSIGR